ncbi:AAA family ATPase [Halorarius halobius]|uniref:AAA family ATPase n=1 Tax=Halorarius halobius TaxID=2962671 RepID=UPI0020CFB7D5|nr:MoxR family ATPase [Halorarius halobius]
MTTDDTTTDLDVETLQHRLDAVREQVGRRLIGQEELLDRLLVCLLCDGNALLESNPGLAKTLTVRTLAAVTDLSFSRVQNTPDLMPSDITGTEVIRETDSGRTFDFEEGPVFANVVLADEINRATPKTQAALLEAMEEQQVTAGGETRPLPEPFFLLATQNPIEQEGTYRLPEAQADRFLLKLLVDYPSRDEELEIVDRYTTRVDEAIPVEQVLSAEELLAAQRLVREVPIADDIEEHAVDLVRATREADRIDFGASPRASMALVVTAKARALLEGRSYVSEDDVEAMAKPVFRHRVGVDFRAEREGATPDDVIDDLL